MRRLRLVLLALSAMPVLLAGATSAAGPWASEASATIHPGVRVTTEGAQCTANFVFEQFRKLSDGSTVRELFLGMAAHCASRGDNSQTNGCTTPTHPPGTPVEIEGAQRLGELVYSSWWTMQRKNETRSNRCLNNDFALVAIHPGDFGRVNPTVPVWGGPEGIGDATQFGENVYTYGRSELRFGLQSDHEGVSLGTEASGWSHRVYTVTPGIPGDSGSAFLDAGGDAIGILSTIQAAPYPASNGVTDLSKALAYLKGHTKKWDGVKLARGTRGFSSGLLP